MESELSYEHMSAYTCDPTDTSPDCLPLSVYLRFPLCSENDHLLNFHFKRLRHTGKPDSMEGCPTNRTGVDAAGLKKL